MSRMLFATVIIGAIAATYLFGYQVGYWKGLHEFYEAPTDLIIRSD